ncbi:MAG: hypothetical protein ACE148_03230 [Vicinamibacterales bacterium]
MKSKFETATCLPLPETVDMRRSMLRSVVAAILGGAAGFLAAVGFVALLGTTRAGDPAGSGRVRPTPQEHRLEDGAPGRAPVLRYAACNLFHARSAAVPATRSLSTFPAD